MHTIHITGGCGYVGSRTAVALAKKGYKTVIIDKATPEERHAVLPPDSEYRKANLTDPVQARKALHDAQIVVHMAANIGSMTYMYEHQGEIMWENSAIDAAVYPVYRDVGVKTLLYSSTSMAHQHSPRYPYVEADLKDTPPPSNVYGFSKLGGEYYCRSFKKQYNCFDYVIVRFHNIWGPGEDSKGSTPGDIHVLPALAEKILRGQYPLEFLGDPAATRTFTYIDDTVDAVVQLLEKVIAKDTLVLNNDFNIASPEIMSILELGKRLWRQLGDGREFKYTVKDAASVSHTARRREANAAKLLSAVEWKPKMSFEEGVEKTAEWVREVIARS
ncbi:MAG: NAD(P)-dependent oxidoreductase [Patescibacteria group bacterium]